jgi:Pyridoxamine 5'-phosphate oxidase
MVSWSAVEKAEPEFAAKVRGLLDARKHKTIATLRADGSPRISGIEAEFADGELTFGSMPGARKGADLHRDPRFALHGPTTDPPDDDPSRWPGEAKISGRARFVKVLDGADGPPGELFRAEIDQVVFTGLNAAGNALVVETWQPQQGLRRIERA